MLACVYLASMLEFVGGQSEVLQLFGASPGAEF